MKSILLIFTSVLVLGIPKAMSTSPRHTPNSGEINLRALEQIENLIRKKAGAELEKNHENSFILNGYNIYTEVIEHRFGPTIFEESFCEIKNSDNKFRMRLIKNQFLQPQGNDLNDGRLVK